MLLRTRATVLRVCLLSALLASALRAEEPGAGGEPGGMPEQRESAWKADEGKKGEGESEGKSGESAKTEELPAPLGPLFDALDPGLLQRRIDLRLGLETERSDKPRAPELPLSVFVESVRPLGSLKYENQLNYLMASFTGDAPTLQTMTYEYVFADWHAFRAEVIAPRNGSIDAFGLGYQQTLGVGQNHNWAHGFLVLPEFSLRGTGFVGGSAFYTVAWKPEEKSPWTIGFSGGANRASFSNRPLSGAIEGGTGSMMQRLQGTQAETVIQNDEARVWRPFFAGNLWHTFSPTWTVGLEAVAYPNDKFGEYLVQPNVTWRPTKHFFVQVGAGWYEAGGRGQASFMVRVNLLNPSPRRAAD